MARRLDNEGVDNREFDSLRKLAGKNFGRFAVAVQHTSEEVQLKLIAQLPEFRKLAVGALDSVDKSFLKTLEANQASESSLQEAYKQWRDALAIMLDDPDLTLDDKLRITAEIGKSVRMQAEGDRESKSFKMALLRTGVGGAVTVLAIVVMAISGGKAGFESGSKDA